MKKALIIGGAVVAVGAAGFFFYRNQIDKLYEMEYKFVGVNFDKLSYTDTIANLKIQITSKSTLEAAVSDLDLEIYINGKLFGTVKSNETIIIPAKGYSVADVKVQVNAAGIVAGGTQLLGQIWKDKDAMLTVKGKAKVKSAFIKLPINIDYTESIKYLMSDE